MAKVSSRCLHGFLAAMLVEHRAPPTWRLYTGLNWRKTFRRKSKVWENAETSNLEKCLLYLSPIILQFLNFIHWIVFDLIFCCVTVKTIYFQWLRINCDVQEQSSLLTQDAKMTWKSLRCCQCVYQDAVVSAAKRTSRTRGFQPQSRTRRAKTTVSIVRAWTIVKSLLNPGISYVRVSFVYLKSLEHNRNVEDLH